MKRPDSKHLQRIQKTFGKAKAREWAELPALAVSTEQISNTSYDVDNIHNLEHGLEDLLPFEEMIFYLQETGEKTKKILWYGKIKHVPLDPSKDEGQKLAVEVIIPHGPKECYMPRYTVLFVPGGVTLLNQKIRVSKKTTPPLDIEQASKAFFSPYKDETLAKDVYYIWEKGVPMPIVPVAGIVNVLVQFEEQDQRPVVVRRKTSFKDKELNRTNPGARRDLQSLIYLDSIPEEHQAANASTGQGSPLKMGHRRRGHWRQLTHPRYKTKRKVRVRPSWVGPDQWSHNGSLYKLTHIVGSQCEVEL